MKSSSSRFSSAATSATQRTPGGVSRKEGWAALAMTASITGLLAVLWQAQNLPWGGLITFGAHTIFPIVLVVFTSLAAKFRGVHPRGYRRGLVIAGGWAVLVAGVAGWPWMTQGPHPTSPWITTLVALVAMLPGAIVASRLVRDGR